jgi:hypothetical protein
MEKLSKALGWIRIVASAFAKDTLAEESSLLETNR